MKTLAFGLAYWLVPAIYILIPAGLHSQWKNPPQKKVLKNGLTVITQKDEVSTVTVIEILIKGGKRSEPAGKKGLSYLTTRLSLEIPDQGKVQELMENSSHYSMTTKGDYSVIHLECLTDNLEPMLKVFVKILKKPLFSGIRIDRIKDYMDDERKIENDSNINTGHLTHLETLLKDLGYSGSIYGESESLKNIKGRDIEAYCEKYFVAQNMILAAVSDLEPDKLLPILNKFFSSFPSVKTEEPAFPDSQPANVSEPRETILEKDTKQALVSLGYRLPKISPRNRALAGLLENLLGKGPGSRLWRLRTEKKLAYNVICQVTLMKESGILEAYLETESVKKDAAREELKIILRELYDKGVAADELQDAKALVKANFLRSNETKDRRTETLASFEALGLGLEFLWKYFQELDSVTPKDINAFIKEFLNPDKSALVIVGPKN